MSAFLTSRKRAAAAELADWMECPEGQASSLESIGRALSRRNHGRSRAVVLAHDHEEAIKGLRAIADGKQKPYVFSTDGPATNGPVWAMAGFGAQHRKMGKNLYLRNEVFAEWIEKVDALIQDERGYSVLELILDDSVDYGIETSNVVIFAIQIALGEVLKHHGAKPAAVIGQSLGEPASAYFAGGLSLADATRVICSRSHLMGEGEAMLFGEYIRFMALVEYSADELKTVFADFPGLEVCVYAAPSQTVIGGPPDQIDAIVARAESEGRFARKLQTKGAGHTSQMDPLLGEFSAELQGISPMSPKVGIFSTVHEGTLRPARRRADPRCRLLAQGHAAFGVLHPRRPQRRRQRVHHVPGARAEPGRADADRLDHGGRGIAGRPADPDAGPQAGRRRVDDLGDGAVVRVTATTSTSARCSAARPVQRIMRTSRRPGSAARSTGWTRTSPATARCSCPARTSRCRTAGTSGSTRRAVRPIWPRW